MTEGNESLLRKDEFAGHVCIVTGAARGIGAGIAEALGRRGGSVVVLDRDGTAARERAELLSRAVADRVRVGG